MPGVLPHAATSAISRQAFTPSLSRTNVQDREPQLSLEAEDERVSARVLELLNLLGRAS